MDYGDQFRGKKVVITGAAGIFGRWIAESFAKAGAKLCLPDIREEELKAMLQLLTLQQSEVWYHRTDLTDPRQIQQLAAEVAGSGGG